MDLVSLATDMWTQNPSYNPGRYRVCTTLSVIASLLWIFHNLNNAGSNAWKCDCSDIPDMLASRPSDIAIGIVPLFYTSQMSTFYPMKAYSWMGRCHK